MSTNKHIPTHSSDVEKVMSEVASWDKASLGCRRSFKNLMRPKCYGRDALTQAWSWFHIGWNLGYLSRSRQKRLRVKDMRVHPIYTGGINS